MAKKKHEQLIRDFFRFMDARDSDQMGALLTDDIVTVAPGGPPYGGTYEGKEAVLGTMKVHEAADQQLFPEGLLTNVNRILEAGDNVVVEWSNVVKLGGKEHTVYGGSFIKVAEGKISFIQDYFDTTEVASLLMSDNEKLVRKFWDAIDKYDYDSLAEVLADDLVWRFPGEPPIGRLFEARKPSSMQ